MQLNQGTKILGRWKQNANNRRNVKTTILCSLSGEKASEETNGSTAKKHKHEIFYMLKLIDQNSDFGKSRLSFLLPI